VAARAIPSPPPAAWRRYDVTLDIELSNDKERWLDDFGLRGPAPEAAPRSWDKSPVANGAHYFLYGKFDPVAKSVLQESGFGVTFPNYIVDIQKDEEGRYKEAIQFQCLERGGAQPAAPRPRRAAPTPRRAYAAPSLRCTASPHATLAFPCPHPWSDCLGLVASGLTAAGWLLRAGHRRSHLRGHQLPVSQPDDEQRRAIGYV
jgi:hypothetical protein